MNERIKKLAKESGIELFEDKSFGWSVIAGTDNHLYKFAKLIVNECIGCLYPQLNEKYTPEELLQQAKYRNLIKEHFGVEECMN